MKRVMFAAVAASLLLGVCVFVTGCGSATGGSDKMGMAHDEMSDSKMSDSKMSDSKMDKMAGQ